MTQLVHFPVSEVAAAERTYAALAEGGATPFPFAEAPM
jgi:hypothetical protein